MKLFSTNTIGITHSLRKVGTNSFGDDIMSGTYEELAGVILAPVSTNDLPEGHENLDEVLVEVHFPSTFTAFVGGASFVILGGYYAGRSFKILGDSLAYEGSPVIWNRAVRAKEVRE